MTTLRCLSVSLLAAIVVSVGCSRLPELAPVSGRVTLDGKPLEFGGVMFQPERGPASTAAIGKDGRFTLTWQRKSAGAVIGLNRVAVTAYESATRPTADVRGDTDRPDLGVKTVAAAMDFTSS